MNQGNIIVDCAYILLAVAFIFPLYFDYTNMCNELRHKSLYEAKHPQKDSSTKQSKKKSKVIEPYDTKSYWKEPLNTDIQGFWNSFRQNH